MDASMEVGAPVTTSQMVINTASTVSNSAPRSSVSDLNQSTKHDPPDVQKLTPLTRLLVMEEMDDPKPEEIIDRISGESSSSAGGFVWDTGKSTAATDNKSDTITSCAPTISTGVKTTPPPGKSRRKSANQEPPKVQGSLLASLVAESLSEDNPSSGSKIASLLNNNTQPLSKPLYAPLETSGSTPMTRSEDQVNRSQTQLSMSHHGSSLATLLSDSTPSLLHGGLSLAPGTLPNTFPSPLQSKRPRHPSATTSISMPLHCASSSPISMNQYSPSMSVPQNSLSVSQNNVSISMSRHNQSNASISMSQLSQQLSMAQTGTLVSPANQQISMAQTSTLVSPANQQLSMTQTSTLVTHSNQQMSMAQSNVSPYSQRLTVSQSNVSISMPQQSQQQSVPLYTPSISLSQTNASLSTISSASASQLMSSPSLSSPTLVPGGIRQSTGSRTRGLSASGKSLQSLMDLPMNTQTSSDSMMASRRDVGAPANTEVLRGFLFVTNTEGTIDFVSSNVADYLNYQPVNLKGRSAYEIIHPEDHVHFNVFLEKLKSDVDVVDNVRVGLGTVILRFILKSDSQSPVFRRYPVLITRQKFPTQKNRRQFPEGQSSAAHGPTRWCLVCIIRMPLPNDQPSPVSSPATKTSGFLDAILSAAQASSSTIFNPPFPASSTTGSFNSPSTATGRYNSPSTTTGSFNSPSTATGSFNSPSTATGGFNSPTFNIPGTTNPSISGAFFSRGPVVCSTVSISRNTSQSPLALPDLGPIGLEDFLVQSQKQEAPSVKTDTSRPSATPPHNSSPLPHLSPLHSAHVPQNSPQNKTSISPMILQSPSLRPPQSSPIESSSGGPAPSGSLLPAQPSRRSDHRSPVVFQGLTVDPEGGYRLEGSSSNRFMDVVITVQDLTTKIKYYECYLSTPKGHTTISELDQLDNAKWLDLVNPPDVELWNKHIQLVINSDPRLPEDHSKEIQRTQCDIYRARIASRWVFLNTLSVPLHSGDTESPSYVVSYHNIIRDCESEAELKGNPTTSLRKSLTQTKTRLTAPHPIKTPPSSPSMLNSQPPPYVHQSPVYTIVPGGQTGPSQPPMGHQLHPHPAQMASTGSMHQMPPGNNTNRYPYHQPQSHANFHLHQGPQASLYNSSSGGQQSHPAPPSYSTHQHLQPQSAHVAMHQRHQLHQQQQQSANKMPSLQQQQHLRHQSMHQLVDQSSQPMSMDQYAAAVDRQRQQDIMRQRRSSGPIKQEPQSHNILQHQLSSPHLTSDTPASSSQQPQQLGGMTSSSASLQQSDGLVIMTSAAGNVPPVSTRFNSPLILPGGQHQNLTGRSQHESLEEIFPGFNVPLQSRHTSSSGTLEDRAKLYSKLPLEAREKLKRLTQQVHSKEELTLRVKDLLVQYIGPENFSRSCQLFMERNSSVPQASPGSETPTRYRSSISVASTTSCSPVGLLGDVSTEVQSPDQGPGTSPQQQLVQSTTDSLEDHLFPLTPNTTSSASWMTTGQSSYIDSLSLSLSSRVPSTPQGPIRWSSTGSTGETVLTSVSQKKPTNNSLLKQLLYETSDGKPVIDTVSSSLSPPSSHDPVSTSKPSDASSKPSGRRRRMTSGSPGACLTPLGMPSSGGGELCRLLEDANTSSSSLHLPGDTSVFDFPDPPSNSGSASQMQISSRQSGKKRRSPSQASSGGAPSPKRYATSSHTGDIASLFSSPIHSHPPQSPVHNSRILSQLLSSASTQVESPINNLTVNVSQSSRLITEAFKRPQEGLTSGPTPDPSLEGTGVTNSPLPLLDFDFDPEFDLDNLLDDVTGPNSNPHDGNTQQLEIEDMNLDDLQGLLTSDTDSPLASPKLLNRPLIRPPAPTHTYPTTQDRDKEVSDNLDELNQILRADEATRRGAPSSLSPHIVNENVNMPPAQTTHRLQTYTQPPVPPPQQQQHQQPHNNFQQITDEREVNRIKRELEMDLAGGVARSVTSSAGGGILHHHLQLTPQQVDQQRQLQRHQQHQHQLQLQQRHHHQQQTSMPRSGPMVGPGSNGGRQGIGESTPSLGSLLEGGVDRQSLQLHLSQQQRTPQQQYNSTFSPHQHQAMHQAFNVGAPSVGTSQQDPRMVAQKQRLLHQEQQQHFQPRPPSTSQPAPLPKDPPHLHRAPQPHPQQQPVLMDNFAKLMKEVGPNVNVQPQQLAARGAGMLHRLPSEGTLVQRAGGQGNMIQQTPMGPGPTQQQQPRFPRRLMSGQAPPWDPHHGSMSHPAPPMRPLHCPPRMPGLPSPQMQGMDVADGRHQFPSPQQMHPGPHGIETSRLVREELRQMVANRSAVCHNSVSASGAPSQSLSSPSMQSAGSGGGASVVVKQALQKQLVMNNQQPFVQNQRLSQPASSQPPQPPSYPTYHQQSQGFQQQQQMHAPHQQMGDSDSPFFSHFLSPSQNTGPPISSSSSAMESVVPDNIVNTLFDLENLMSESTPPPPHSQPSSQQLSTSQHHQQHQISQQHRHTTQQQHQTPQQHHQTPQQHHQTPQQHHQTPQQQHQTPQQQHQTSQQHHQISQQQHHQISQQQQHNQMPQHQLNRTSSSSPAQSQHQRLLSSPLPPSSRHQPPPPYPSNRAAPISSPSQHLTPSPSTLATAGDTPTLATVTLATKTSLKSSQQMSLSDHQSEQKQSGLLESLLSYP